MGDHEHDRQAVVPCVEGWMDDGGPPSRQGAPQSVANSIRYGRPQSSKLQYSVDEECWGTRGAPHRIDARTCLRAVLLFVCLFVWTYM